MAKSHKRKSKCMSSKRKFKFMKHEIVLKRKFIREQKKRFDFEPDTLLRTECKLQRLQDLLPKGSRSKLQMENRIIEDLIDEATLKVKNFKLCYDHEVENVSIKRNSNYIEFKNVVDVADVILEVLDARDPLGCRYPQVEQLVLSTGKRLVLVLNKIDLIPKNNLIEWLKYLRQEVPTVAFKASVETEGAYLSKSEDTEIHITESLLSSRCCVGASFLINLLENYCRSQNTQTLVKVGVVGFPNVGKRSVVRSLKQFHSCTDGEATDIVNAIKNLSLNKHFEILDNSGIVYPKNDSSVTLALHNTVRVEDLKDVISPAEAILQKVDHLQLCLHYCVPRFSSCHEFLCSLAAKMGKFENTGNPNFKDGARRLINDWNTGKIKYYTHPPEMFIQSEYISAEYSAQMSKVFDISLETEQIELDKAPLLFPITSIATKSSEPTEGLLGKGTEANDYTQTKVITEFDINTEKLQKLKMDQINLTAYSQHKLFKKRFKKMKHKKKKCNRRLALALSESVDASLTHFI